MQLNSQVENLVGIPYVRANGPDRVPSLVHAKDYGANCQVIVREALLALRVTTRPVDTRSKEIQLDASYSVPVPPESTRGGDIVIFESRPGQDPRNNHLAIHSGLVDQDGNPLLLHGTNRDGGVSTLWRPDQFKPYYRVKMVKRIVS